MPRYAQVSGEVMAALSALSPIIEPVSIDEAYVDITGLERLFGSPQEIGRRAKALVADAVGLPASVGIGPNRLIAKLASEHEKPNGLTVVTDGSVRAFLDPMPIEVLRGVGVRTAPRLRRLGLETVGDLRRTPLERLRRVLGGRHGTALHLQARGLADDRVEPSRQRKSISKETTFSEDIVEPESLRETLRWAAQEVGYLARHAQRFGSLVTLKIRFRGFETHTRSQTLSAPTADDRTLFRTACHLLETAPWGPRPVRLIGLGLSGWPDENPTQPDLFAGLETASQQPESLLTDTLDAIRERFGAAAIRRGAPRVPRR
jgi:DNA polymerase-4